MEIILGRSDRGARVIHPGVRYRWSMIATIARAAVAITLVFAVGCGNSERARDRGSASPAAAPKQAGWGEPCTPQQPCAGEFACTRWMTEGAEVRHTCEIACGADDRCRDGLGCVEQGGGPSHVCLGEGGSHTR